MEKKKCKKCNENIKKDAKTCPKCGFEQGNPLWAKILVAVFIFMAFCALVSGGGTNSNDNDNNSKSNTTKEVTKKKVKVVDLSKMTTAERDTWCKDNKVVCTTKTDYSDSVAKDGFISQSVEADREVYEGDEIVVTFSLGKKPTIGQQNALAKAKSYSKLMHMSKRGIYDQLTSEYGEGFTAEEAQYAIDNLEVDYKANALEKAKSYQQTMHMSKSAIYEQLVSEYGEKFTAEEAQYAVDHLED